MVSNDKTGDTHKTSKSQLLFGNKSDGNISNVKALTRIPNKITLIMEITMLGINADSTLSTNNSYIEMDENKKSLQRSSFFFSNKAIPCNHHRI